jgi:TRAP transporter TAXI family solute receptor
MIAAGRPEDSYFAMSQALSTFINADSKWLKAYALATGGMTDANNLFVADPATRQKGLVVSCNIYDVPGELGLWKQGGWQPKIVAAEEVLTFTWVTYDKNIKTIQDFAGKTIGVARTSSTTWPVEQAILKEEGVLDKVKLEQGGASALVTAMVDGKVAAADLHYDFIYPNTFAPGSDLQQLSARGQYYFVGWNKDAMARAAQKLQMAPFTFEMPVGALGPNQTQALYNLFWLTWWMADASMPADIVYEVTRILYAHLSDFKKYHAKGAAMTPDFIAMSTWPASEREKWFHPGALQFYKEKGVPLKTYGAQ